MWLVYDDDDLPRWIWGSHSGNLINHTYVKEYAKQETTGFFLGLYFDYEDGGDMFLWNVGWLSMDNTVLYHRR
jgi:hypothetical protein